jgi:5-methyltetrahydrofolate--homocysteine methyltransferase
MKTEISNGQNTVSIERGKPSVMIGERCSTVGFKKISEAVKNGNFDVLIEEAKIQVEAGAKILDVCVIGKDINEKEMLPKAVDLISRNVNVPLAIEYGDPAALEEALNVYKGKPLVNSFNGENEKIETVLPILRKYKPAVIVLPIDNEHGIPRDAETRIKVADKIINLLVKEGLNREDIIVDCLVTAAATETEQVKEQFNRISRSDCPDAKR